MSHGSQCLDPARPAPMTGPAESLTDLVVAAGGGDRDAWDALVARFTPLLWSVGRAYRLDDASAADVVQTCWLRLLENLTRIREPERLAGWLVTTARRECLTVLTRAGREVPAWDGDVLEVVPDPADPIETGLLTDERDAVLWRCFRRLSERCQALLRVLVMTDAGSYADVSASLGLPIGSLGPTRMRCLDRLRTLTGESGYAFDHPTPPTRGEAPR